MPEALVLGLAVGYAAVAIASQSPMDIVGLETVFAIGDHWANVTGDEQKRKNTDWLKENYLDKGLLGMKSGEGFYKYPDPEYGKPDFLK